MVQLCVTLAKCIQLDSFQ